MSDDRCRIACAYHIGPYDPACNLQTGAKLLAEVESLKAQLSNATDLKEAFQGETERQRKLISDLSAIWSETQKKLTSALLQVGDIPKKILAAVNAEQLRCGQIAEAFWNAEDKLNIDCRVKLTQAEKNMAYIISANIRAMRWREENFIEKPKGVCTHNCLDKDYSTGHTLCMKELPCPDHDAKKPKCGKEGPAQLLCEREADHDGMCMGDCSKAYPGKRNDETERLIAEERRLSSEVRCDCGVPGCNKLYDHRK